MRHLLILAAMLAFATAALADDSTASTAAGGLVLQRTDAIDMVAEDLYISAKAIRIHFVFRNPTPKDVATVVAFIMPDREFAKDCALGDVAYPSNFRTRVASVPVKSQLERKAVVKGKDYTALLRQFGIPIAPDSVDAAIKAMDQLSPEQKKHLQSLGLAGHLRCAADVEPDSQNLRPLWAVRDRYWWTQRFPAGRDLVVDHQYRPGTGSNAGTGLTDPEWRKARQYGQQEIADYCMDRHFLAGIDRLARAEGDGGAPGPPEYWIDYVLTTGANWRSPIGSFRLLVDKGKPGNLVSFCEMGVKKISPTQYEVRHANWRPTRDLRVVIIDTSS